MALPVKLSAVADQLEMVSDFMTVYIHRKTGELAALIEDDISYGDQDDDEDELRQRVEDDDDLMARPTSTRSMNMRSWNVLPSRLRTSRPGTA
jgi:hypothetical protein